MPPTFTQLPSGTRRKPCRVLVVDSHAPTRRQLVRLLAEDGHDVVHAARSIEFHRRLFEMMRAPNGALLPTVVVASLREPDRTIDRLCRFCMEEWKMPVVVLTGETPDELARADAVGAMAVCTTGDPEEVRAAVSSASLQARRVAG